MDANYNPIKETCKLEAYGDGSCQLHSWLAFFTQADMDTVVEFVDRNDFKFDFGGRLGNKTFLQMAKDNVEKTINSRSKNKIQVLYLRAYLALKLLESDRELRNTSGATLEEKIRNNQNFRLDLNDNTYSNLLGIGKNSDSMWVASDTNILKIIAKTLRTSVAVYEKDLNAWRLIEYNDDDSSTNEMNADSQHHEEYNIIMGIINPIVRNGITGCHFNENPGEEESVITRTGNLIAIQLKDGHYQPLLPRSEKANIDDKGCVEKKFIDPYFIDNNRHKINVKKTLASIGIAAPVIVSALAALFLPAIGITLLIASIGLIPIAVSGYYLHKARRSGNALDAYENIDKKLRNGEMDINTNETINQSLAPDFRKRGIFVEHILNRNYGNDGKAAQRDLRPLIETGELNNER